MTAEKVQWRYLSSPERFNVKGRSKASVFSYMCLREYEPSILEDTFTTFVKVRFGLRPMKAVVGHNGTTHPWDPFLSLRFGTVFGDDLDHSSVFG